jgi:hypothetical protein
VCQTPLNKHCRCPCRKTGLPIAPSVPEFCETGSILGGRIAQMTQGICCRTTTAKPTGENLDVDQVGVIVAPTPHDEPIAAGLAPAARILRERASLELPSRAEGGRPCWAVIVLPQLAIQAQQRNRHSSHLLARGVIPCLSVIDLDAELVQTFQGSTHAD